MIRYYACRLFALRAWNWAVGLAYANPSGARHPSRWQYVQDLLAARIQIASTVTFSSIAELQDQIEAITGKRRSETVPISFLESASEIEIVDVPSEEPMERPPEEQPEAQNGRTDFPGSVSWL